MYMHTIHMSMILTHVIFLTEKHVLNVKINTCEKYSRYSCARVNVSVEGRQDVTHVTDASLLCKQSPHVLATFDMKNFPR